MKTMPIKHLSARVPWHDQKWQGSVCCNVVDNSFCRILPNIDSKKDPAFESTLAGMQLSLLNEEQIPPCLSEKGTFMSKDSYIRHMTHAYKDANNPLFKDFLPTVFHHKPFSINAIPFLWMSKDAKTHESEMARLYELEYDSRKEAQIELGFQGKWVQHRENQKALLDGFFNCLRPHESLVFFYCKSTPMSESNTRVIVGVARVKYVGDIVDFEYPAGYSGHRSYAWDRCVGHTLTDDLQDGFLMPYHEILEKHKAGDDINLEDCTAFATDFMQFSYASELVDHDVAIESLLQMTAALKQSAKVLETSFTKELQWIDDRIAEIWDMRGAFPGIGPVLSALKFENANSIAWEIEKYISQQDGDLSKTNPWEIFEAEIEKPGIILGARGLENITPTNKRLWKLTPAKKKEFLKLVSRCQLDNDQSALAIMKAESIDDFTNNPYLLFEDTRFLLEGFTFQQIDKALLPVEKVQLQFPVPEPSRLEDNLDERRVRALLVLLLEEAAAEGHSLLPEEELLERLEKKQLEPLCPINKDILEAYADFDFIKELITVIPKTKENQTTFYKLKRLTDVKNYIQKRLSLDQVEQHQHQIDMDWMELIREKFGDGQLSTTDLKARREKAEALKILCTYRFSVLIGPAGSGKTSLLQIFENIPEVKQGGVLKLAPTGKARVKLGKDAKTIAQFLIPDRYNAKTGEYRMNQDARKNGTLQTVIVDEASMLTEEQFAALLDALGSVKRIILVGDYRQLPPIGTGRPFADIVRKIKPEHFHDPEIRTGPAYAELVQIHRQSKSGEGLTDRIDVRLSRCFGDQVEKEDLDMVQSLLNDAFADANQSHLRLEKWYDSNDLRDKLRKVIKEELLLGDGQEELDFNLSLGAVKSGPFQYFNRGMAEKRLEDWQVISPVNGYGYGIKEINRFIQTTYRKPFINLAYNVDADRTKKRSARKVAKPKGADNVVYGDKVINLRNTTWENWQQIKPREQKATALNYIANGEIGILTGEFRSKNDTSRGEPNIEISFSTQPGYSYVFKPNQLGDEGEYPVELAYCISVHKAQGSGFKKVFFILPSGSSIVSRELLYTALTRQEDRIIILHQGEFRDFLKFASDQYSETARRYTDLFELPVLREYQNKSFDSRYVNISERGEPMISKSEVIIANSLLKYEYQGLIVYSYEDKLRLNENVLVRPDFRIQQLATGREFYWEHLGMMSQDYRKKWERKLEAYREAGYVTHMEATGGDKKVLILTEEKPGGGIDSKYIDELINTVIL